MHVGRASLLLVRNNLLNYLVNVDGWLMSIWVIDIWSEGMDRAPGTMMECGRYCLISIDFAEEVDDGQFSS